MTSISTVPVQAVGWRLPAAVWNLMAAAVNALLGALVYRVHNASGGGVAVPASTWTPLPMDTVDQDDAAVYDSTHQTRFTPSRPGLYRITARVGFTGFSTGVVGVSIQTNSGGDHLTRQIVSGASVPSYAQCIDEIWLNGTGDYAEAMAYQSSGAAQSTVAGTARLTAVWVRN